MKKYYFYDGTTQHGPFTLEELRAKKITVETSAWFHPMPQWKPAGEIEELKPLFDKTAAAPPPVTTPAPAAKEEDWNNKQFYFTDSAGAQQGPFKLKQLEGKNITSHTAVWYDPLPKWTTAGKVAALKDIIDKPVAAPHPVAAPAPAPKEEDWNNKQFYFTDDKGAQQGPFKLKQLEGKNITSHTAVWYDPLPKWTTAGEVAALKDIINKAVTAPHPVAAPAPAAKEEDWNNKQYYFMDSTGAQQGPFKLKQLEGKNITAHTAVWYHPLPKWTTAGEVAALKDIINKTEATATAAATVSPVTAADTTATEAATAVATAAAPHPVTAPAHAAKEEDWSNKQYFFADSTGAQQGPFKLEQLKEKNIVSETPIWYDPLPKWTTAGEVAALKDIINKPAATS